MSEERLDSTAGWTESWTESSTEGWTEEGWSASCTDFENMSSSVPPVTTGKDDSLMTVYVQVLLSPLVFLGNILILMTIRRSKSMKKVTYLFLGHLAVADLMFGVAMCTRFFLIVTDSLYKYPCLINQCFVITAGGSSSTGVLFLSLEGYLSVKYFMSFKRVFTPRLAWVMIAGCWLVWVSIALLSIILAAFNPVEKAACYLGGGYYERWYLVLLATPYFCQLSLVIYYQLGTVVITRNHFAKTRLQIQPSDYGKIQVSAQNAVHRRRLRRLASLSKLVGMVLVVFFVCWSPSMVGLCFIATCEKNCAEVSKTALNLASLLVVNSLANVFIYAIKGREFREGFQKALRPRCRRMGVEK